MPIQECMEKHTNRQMQAWIKWLEFHWADLKYSDWLQLRISQRIHQGFAKHPNKVTLEGEKVEFKYERALSPEEKAQRSKQIWTAIANKSISKMQRGNKNKPKKPLANT